MGREVFPRSLLPRPRRVRIYVTPAIRNLIREGKVAQMYSSIQTGVKEGMQTLDQCLQDLLAKGAITKEEARFKAQNKDSF